ncbi:MAG: hypothetical protein ACKOCZ_06055 [Betaproteobacteria bacterium]
MLEKFVSSRTRRAFKAMLAWDAEADKVNFEFAPSKYPARKAGAGTRTAPATQVGAARKKTAAAKAPAKAAKAPRQASEASKKQPSAAPAR